MEKQENVILVDTHNKPIGAMEKMEAHRKGLLHRAFSVFIFNQSGDLLLQKRAAHKYHSPLLWTNTCCSHQRYGETNLQAGQRRLQEEMGIQVPLQEIFSFIYKAPFNNGLTEYEYDHVMVGYFDGQPAVNPYEVAAFKWMGIGAIKKDITKQATVYTEWFKIIFKKFYARLENKALNL